jgi:hypothetical protein
MVKSTRTSFLTFSSTASTRRSISVRVEEDIYEVLVGPRADGTSVSTLCDSINDSSPANTVLYHLRTKFELDQLERVGSTPPPSERRC